MPERRPVRAIPVPAGMDPEQRVKLAVELAEPMMDGMATPPAEATGMLKEVQWQLGQVIAKLWVVRGNRSRGRRR